MIEGGRAACLDAARTQTVHEIAHLQAFPDVVLRIKLAARIECMRAALDDAEAECDVGRNHEIAWRDAFHDLIVGDVEPARHLQDTYEG